METPPNAARPRYEIVGLLGEGGRGEVYRAWDKILRRHVALKRLASGADADARAQAWQEAMHLAAVQHPNVVTVFDCGEDAQGPFLVMEFIDGETLDAVVAREVFPLQDFRVLVQQSLEGLAAAHQAGLLHRDLKPGNFMLKHGPTDELQVKLIDFGIAGFTATFLGDVLPPASDQAGTILGTIEYMAPEQFERQPVSVRNELYSMGCIFYYTLAGREPFEGDSVEAVVGKHLDAQAVPLETLREDLPIPVCQWVMRLLSRNPEHRPGSAVEALADFHGLFAGPLVV